MFLTDAQILQSIADCLQLAGGTAALPPYWTNIVARQHIFAYQTIVAAMVNRGFTLTQIQQWDMGPYYEQQLSEYFVFTDSASTHRLDTEILKLRDIREDLKTVVFTIGGGFVQPGASGDEPGTIGHGDIQSDLGNDLTEWPCKHKLEWEKW